MKKLLLLFLLSVATMQGQTRSAIQVQIDAIATGVPNTALKVRTVLNSIADGTAQTGDIKEIDVTNAYMTANFDSTGLGINERLGWAICNGNNGTRNRSGRVSLQWDSNYPTLGAIGGSADAVLVTHNHIIADQSGSSGSGTTNIRYIGKEIETNSLGTAYTDSAGVSGTNKNLQPYIVSLFIMKL